MPKKQVRKIRGAISMELALAVAIILVIASIIGFALWRMGGAQAQELRANIELHASTSGFVVNSEVLQGQLGGAPTIRYAPAGSTNYQQATCTLLTGVANAKAGQSASFVCTAALTGGGVYDVIVTVPGAGGRGFSKQMPGVMIPVT
jgi:hypothetical protein